MSKQITAIATPAEESGWDLWQYGKSNALVFDKKISSPLSPSNLSPSTCLALPLRSLSTLPLIISSIDPELCQGAAQLALEKASFIPEEDNDHLWDNLRVEQKDEQTLATALSLAEDQLDPADKIRHLSTFDLHARLLTPNTNADSIACWKEQGQWVLAAYRKRIPFYTEPLGELPDNLPLLINLLRSQLQLKGITFTPENVHLWQTNEPNKESDSTTALLDQLKESFTGSPYQLISSDRPQPKLPSPPLDLRPTVVRDHKERLKARSSFLRTLTFVGIIYLAALAFLWWYKKDLNDQITETQKEIRTFTPQHEQNNAHLNQWSQLGTVTNQNWPLRLYQECVKLLPPGKGIRFSLIELQEPQIVIQGTSANFNLIAKYDQALTNSEFFNEYNWITPAPVKNPKTNLWTFKYEGKPASYSETP